MAERESQFSKDSLSKAHECKDYVGIQVYGRMLFARGYTYAYI